jgi:branched-chain amino acid transport system substrate-binding protein
MGTWSVILYLKDSPMKRFYGLGSDYAWGRDSIGLFERTIKATEGKEIVGVDFVPLNTKDFGTYISKIRQAKPDGIFIVMPGQDSTIMFKQSAQFGLSKETKLIHEILQLEDMKAVGDAMTGVIGGSRYPFTLDNPKNRAFVERFYNLHKVYPDMFDGETYEGLEWLAQTMEKAKSDDVEKVIEAWEDSEYESLEGRMVMRKCDHQASQPGFVCEAVKDPKYPHLVPKVIATYPPEKATPKCRTEEFA